MQETQLYARTPRASLSISHIPAGCAAARGGKGNHIRRRGRRERREKTKTKFLEIGLAVGGCLSLSSSAFSALSAPSALKEVKKNPAAAGRSPSQWAIRRGFPSTAAGWPGSPGW